MRARSRAIAPAMKHQLRIPKLIAIVTRRGKPFRKKKKKKRRDSTPFYKVIDELLVAAIRSGDAGTVEPIIEKLSSQTILCLNKRTIMGLYRLFCSAGRSNVVEHIIRIYLSRPEHAHRTLYFLEPLVEFDRMGVLRDTRLLEFVSVYRPPSSAKVLQTLSDSYRPTDEADLNNFDRFVLTPLRALSDDPKNLMDIRFSSEQRTALQTKIRSSLAEGRPLSLLRLGDGEACPFPAPELQGIDSDLFKKDDTEFEERKWQLSPAPEKAQEALKTSFLLAVSRCDILGIPSVYRIIRNLTPPGCPYGTRRNQRAFMRILASLGNHIPTAETVFTEERCHRIIGAIDEPFLLELAEKARSLVLVSSKREIQLKFPVKQTYLPVPDWPPQLFKTYTDVVQSIVELSGPGTLVLIGAGLPAKIMADAARQAGAVALDVGSLMDYMVGLKTRTIADLV